MAILTQYGKLSGTVDSPQLPVTVWTDDQSDLDADDAVTAAIDAAPDDLFGLPVSGAPVIEQINNHAYTIGVLYRVPSSATLPQPPVGEISVDYRMSFQAQPRYVYDALECLGVYDTDGLVSGMERLKVNVRKSMGVNRVVGMQIDPLPEVHSLEVILPNATLTAAYRKDLEALKYCFNDAPFMGYGIGEIQLVRFNVQVRTDQDWQLSFGFGAGETLTDVPFDGNTELGLYAPIVVEEIPPYAVAWTIDRDVLVDFSGTVEKLADFVVVQRVWNFGDFTKLGLGAL